MCIKSRKIDLEFFEQTGNYFLRMIMIIRRFVVIKYSTYILEDLQRIKFN